METGWLHRTKLHLSQTSWSGLKYDLIRKINYACFEEPKKIEAYVLKQDVSYSLEKPEHVHAELEVDVDNDQFLQAWWKLKVVVW